LTYRLVLPDRVGYKILKMGRQGLALLEFIRGPLLENPRRVGKPLVAPFEGQHSARRGPYRVLYVIDDEAGTVTVRDAGHRGTIYQPR